MKKVINQIHSRQEEAKHLKTEVHDVQINFYSKTF